MIHQTPRTLVLVYIVTMSLLVLLPGSASLRNGKTTKDRSLTNSSDIVECTYVKGHDRVDNGSSEDVHACITNPEDEDDGAENVIYTLPDELLKDHDVNSWRSAQTRFRITGATKQRNDYQLGKEDIQLTRGDQSRLEVLSDDSGQRRLASPTSGARTVIVVLVSARDSAPTLSTSTVAGRVFSSGVGFASQYYKCSAGALQFVPASGYDIANGVGSLYIDSYVRGQSRDVVLGMIRTAFVSKYGSESNYGHVIYGFPPGTVRSDGSSWIAFAYNSIAIAYFNDNWVGSLTSTMHEIGHNLGLGHSGQGSNDYGDYSCIMGPSFVDADFPEMCFNGWRHWALGWFSSRHVTVDPAASGAWAGNLIAYVDYPSATSGEYVIIRMGDLFIQYNRAKYQNAEVMAMKDEVTIIQADSSINPAGVSHVKYSLNWAVGLKQFGYSYNGNQIIIEMCAPGTRNGSIDYYRMGIRLNSQASTCTQGPSPTPPAPVYPRATRRPNRQKLSYTVYGGGQRRASSPLGATRCEDTGGNFEHDGEERDCRWLVKNADAHNAVCVEHHPAYSVCPKACNACEEQGSTVVSPGSVISAPITASPVKHARVAPAPRSAPSPVMHMTEEGEV